MGQHRAYKPSPWPGIIAVIGISLVLLGVLIAVSIAWLPAPKL